MTAEIKPVVFQKNWPSTSGFGGAERATERFTKAISETERLAVLTCGEYYRGKTKPLVFDFPKEIFSSGKLTVHEIPSIPLIVDFALRNKNEIGVFQVGWGFEHHPKDFERILDTDLPIVLRICEIGQYKQLVQELPEDKKDLLLHRIIDRVDALVAISSPLVQEAVKIGFDPKKVHLIHSSVDTELFKPVSAEIKDSIRKQIGLPIEKKIFLFAGRLVEAKGIDTLLKSWSLMGLEFKKNNLLIVVGSPTPGDPAFNFVKKSIESSDSSVRFEGVIKDEYRMAKYYQASDVFVYPSIHNEGLSVSILEAMSSGLPVITTKWAATKTGASDLVKIGKNALVFDHTKEDMRTSFNNIDWSRFMEIGCEARKHILTLGVDNRITAAKYIKLYKSLL